MRGFMTNRAAKTLKTKSGDLLDAEEEYILQQCDCVACKPHGLSAAIEKKFPFADPYSRRRSLGQRNFAVKEDQPNPGSIQLLEHEDCSKTVICMYAQYGMGTPYNHTNKGSKAIPDSFQLRQEWFKLCLEQVAEQVAPGSTLAMPFQIGCGLAGGDWKVYNQMITEWAAKFEADTV